MLFSFLFHIVFTFGDYDIDNIKKETSQGDDLGGFDMSDHYFDDFSKEPTRDLDTTPEESSVRSETAAQESSYEWNSSSSHSDGEYHYSFINGNNSDSAHSGEWSRYRDSRREIELTVANIKVLPLTRQQLMSADGFDAFAQGLRRLLGIRSRSFDAQWMYRRDELRQTLLASWE